MPPQQQQPQQFDPQQLMSAISTLKDDLVKEMDTRFAAYDEKFGKVDGIEEVLSKAQQAQEAERQRQEQQRQMQQQAQGYQPKSYEQIKNDAVNEAYNRIRQEDKDAQTKAEREQQLRAQEEAELDAELQRDLDSLRKSGYLPAIGNPHDPNDPGKFAEDELISRAAALETPNIAEVANELAARHNNNEYWDVRTHSYKSAENILTPLPGKTAPVGDSSVNSPSASFQGPTVKEIRELSLQELAQLPMIRGYGPMPTTSSTNLPF